MIIVMTTTPTSSEGEALATKIVEAKLAACVQVLPQMTSVYFWEGRVTKDGEHLLLIKTADEKFVELETFIKANHSYSVPEIVALDVAKVGSDYLDWVDAVVTR